MELDIPIQPAIPLEINFKVRLKTNSIRLPKYLTPALAYFVGLLRDGNLNKCYRSYKVRIYQKDKRFLEEVVNSLSKTLFQKTAKIIQSGSDFVWQLDSKPLFQLITEVFDYPKDKTQKWWKTPSIILQAPLEIQKWYIAGFVDAEGSIRIENKKPIIYIYQSWNNPNECPPLNDLKLMLKQFGINASGPKLYKKGNNAFRLKIKDRSARIFLRTIPLIRKSTCLPPKEPETRWLQSARAGKVLPRS